MSDVARPLATVLVAALFVSALCLVAVATWHGAKFIAGWVLYRTSVWQAEADWLQRADDRSGEAVMSRLNHGLAAVVLACIAIKILAAIATPLLPVAAVLLVMSVGATVLFSRRQPREWRSLKRLLSR